MPVKLLQRFSIGQRSFCVYNVKNFAKVVYFYTNICN